MQIRTSFSLLIRRFVFRLLSPRGERKTRVTGDEAQRTCQRVKKGGEASIPALLCAHIFMEGETSGYETGLAHCDYHKKNVSVDSDFRAV